MSYIGNTATQQEFTPAIDYFSGNGSTVAFTLSRPVATVAQVQAVIENVPQNPTDAFTVSGSTITFTSAPPSGTNNIYVQYTSPITQVIQPGQGTVQPSSLSTGGPYWDASGNVGIGTGSPNYRLDIAGTSNATAFGTTLAYGTAGEVYSAFRFNNASWAGGNSEIRNIVNGAASTGSELAFFTTQTGSGPLTARGGFDNSGNFKFNSGYGSAATAYGCRAWVNFNGTGTVAIRSSGNVSSITDNGVGLYTMNLTTAMPDTNYAVVGSTNDSANNASLFMSEASPAPTVSAAALRCVNSAAGTGQDPSLMSVAIFR